MGLHISLLWSLAEDRQIQLLHMTFLARLIFFFKSEQQHLDFQTYSQSLIDVSCLCYLLHGIRVGKACVDCLHTLQNSVDRLFPSYYV